MEAFGAREPRRAGRRTYDRDPGRRPGRMRDGGRRVRHDERHDDPFLRGCDLAIFPWKKSDGKDGAQSPQAEAAVEYSPEKADKFFQHARAMFEASNHEYSAQLWLGGLRLDPNNLPI